MGKFNESKFDAVITAQWSKVAGVPEIGVPLDLVTLLTELLGGLFMECLNSNREPETSAEIATQLKSAGPIEKLKIKRTIRKYYGDAGKSRKDADTAYETLLSTVKETPIHDLADAIQDARDDANSIPEFDQF